MITHTIQKLVLISLFALSSSVFAEDKINWTGFYGSVMAGYSWGHKQDRGISEFVYDGDTHPPSDPNGFPINTPLGASFRSIGGTLRLGYNKQLDNKVVGLELGGTFLNPDINSSNGLAPSEDSHLSSETRLKSFGTITPRFGYLYKNDTLIYATGGIAFAHFTNTIKNNIWWFEEAQQSKNLIGYEIGLGVEHKITDKWSLRADYEYINFGKNNLNYSGCYNICVPGDSPVTFSQFSSVDFSNLSAGVSYAF